MKRTLIILLVTMLSCIVPAFAQTAKHAASEHPAAAKTSADQLWQKLAEGNVRFVTGRAKPHNHVAKREALAQGQAPEISVLTCSDSRVAPETVFDKGLGDLFVVRAAGNSADPLGIGSLEYAVEHLGSTVIVVLGHQSCGAVKAACSGDKMPSPNLEAVTQPIAPSCSASNKKGDELVDFAVRDHVHRTAQSLLANSAILKHAADEGKLSIVEAYLNLIRDG